MSKQRFLGGLLGANPVRQNSTPASATYSGTWAATDTDFTLVAAPYHTQAINSGSWKNRSFSETLTGTNKYYCEIHVPTSASNIMIGVGNASLPSTSYAGQSGTNGISLYSSNGNYFYNGSGTAYGSVWNSGAKTIGMAIDMGTREIWWSLDGTWQNSSDPSAGTGGIAMAGNIATGDVFINVADNSGTTADFHLNTGENGTFNGVLTAGGNTDTNGLGDFKYAVPTGFSVAAASTPGTTAAFTDPTADRTTANVGILSLDEAGPEAVTATSSTPDTLDLTNTVGTETNPYEVDGIDTTADGAYFASTGITSGKHYWEVDYAVWGDGSGADFYTLGLGVYRGATAPTAGGTWLDGNPYYGFYVQNQNYTNSVVAGALGTASSSAPFPSLAGGTFGVLLDADNHTVTVYVDGVVSSDCNALSTGGSGTETYYPWFGSGGGQDWTHEVNFGQRPFNQTVPAGASAGWLLTSSETRELTQINWGGIRGRDVLTGGTAASGDANWADVTLLLDGSGTTDLSPASPTVTFTASGVSAGNSGGKNGQYIDFAGSGYITVGLDQNIGANGDPFTVETWVLVDNASHDGAAFNLTTTSSFGTATNSIAFGFNTPDWNIYHDGSSSGETVSPGPSAATWYHVATVFDGNDLVYYVDGSVLLTKSNHSANIPGTGYSHVMIGGYYSTGFLLDGRIEDFRVTKGVARDIAADWTAGVYNSALPQGAYVAASSGSLANTGILSLSELLQASYGPTGLSADILVVGGGAGGSETSSGVSMGNGGSGGAVTLASAYDLGTSAITISVGAGGTAAQDSGYDDDGGAGGQSAFGAITASGAPLNTRGVTAQQTSFTTYGGSTTNYTTSETGSGVQGASPYDGLNGAGAGGNASSTAGGDGYLWSVTNARYGAGGGAYKFGGASGYSGGSGGGATGGYGTYTSATTATGYGSGGGGGYLTGYPSSGTSGAVLVYLSGTTYTLAEAQAAFTGAGGDVAVSTPAGGGTLITFTGNGDWTPPAA